MLTGSTNVSPIQGVSLVHHALSHLGKDPSELEEPKIIEAETVVVVVEFLAKLNQSREESTDLLVSSTVITVFLGSNPGDASSHSVRNLTVLLAGGVFRHGQHLTFDPQKPPPLCNLYVSMLQRLGNETDRFSNSTGTLTGLELAG